MASRKVEATDPLGVAAKIPAGLAVKRCQRRAYQTHVISSETGSLGMTVPQEKRNMER